MLDILYNRRSTRKFNDTKIEEPIIRQLLKAALLSPSSKNSQPWEFIVVNDPELLSQLSVAKPHGACLLKHAPLAVVVAGDKSKSDVWIEDCSIASVFLQLAAEALGLGSCWVQIHHRYHDDDQTANEFIGELLHIPDHLEVLSVVGIGYKAVDRPALSEKEIDWQKVIMNSYKGVSLLFTIVLS
ncbi:MAG: nitroreductase family protein [Bacteroidetes bacterium]|nr:nitroreductase family protein [Bacteroidota bacterium]MCL6103135.1 nitroreductase family protein [Bacteroidota bacterium]